MYTHTYIHNTYIHTYTYAHIHIHTYKHAAYTHEQIYIHPYVHTRFLQSNCSNCAAFVKEAKSAVPTFPEREASVGVLPLPLLVRCALLLAALLLAADRSLQFTPALLYRTFKKYMNFCIPQTRPLFWPCWKKKLFAQIVLMQRKLKCCTDSSDTVPGLVLLES